MIKELRTNRYDEKTKTLELTPAQAYAFEQMRKFWDQEFAQGDAHYGFLKNTIPTAAGTPGPGRFLLLDGLGGGHETARPELQLHEQLAVRIARLATRPPPSVALRASHRSWPCSRCSGIVVYVVHRYGFFYGESKAVEAAYRLLETPVTPSQRASAKFFLVAGLLFVVQIFNGGLLAHYTVHPGTFYVKIIGEMYPYSWAKSWHLQLAILWIAVSWMGTAIYLAPLVGRREPPASDCWSTSCLSPPWR